MRRGTCIAGAVAATLASLAVVGGAEEIKPDELARVKAAEAQRIKTIESVYGAVVAMYPKTRQGGGSGVVFDEDGFVLTNNHVMQPIGEEGLGGLADTKLYKLTLIGTDPTGDVAVARLHGKPKFDRARLGDSRTVQVGDFCVAMGNPFVLAEDHRPTVTMGVISGVERYQYGTAGNIGIYGNCLQFDTSINPGNSGGPLFDMDGKVIGINGRGSFEERARINVGLGYAISIQQVKNFLPDLRAAKLCLHGALDATFIDRDGKVVCDQINLDAPIAQAGMGLADTLVAIDGQKIATANQATNILSTYPVKFPVEVTFEHEGVQKTAWVRLKALQVKTAPPRPTVGGRPLPIPSSGPATKPATGPAPAGAATQAKPGEIRNMKLNREECDRILAKWRAFSNESALAGKMLQVTEEMTVGEKKVGSQRITRAADGRFRVDILEGFGDSTTGEARGFDGKEFWVRSADGRVTTSAKDEALARPEVAESLGLAQFRQEDPKAIKDIVLEGSDRAQRQVAFRLRTIDESGRRRTWWFSLLGPDGEFETRLLRTAPAGEDEPMWTYGDYRAVGTMMVPHRRSLVKGLGEQTLQTAAVSKAELIELTPAVFGAGDAK